MVSQVRHCSFCEGMVWVVAGGDGTMFTTRDAALEAALEAPLNNAITSDELEARTRPVPHVTDQVMDHLASTSSSTGPLIRRMWPMFVIDWPMRDFIVNRLDLGSGLIVNQVTRRES